MLRSPDLRVSAECRMERTITRKQVNPQEVTSCVLLCRVTAAALGCIDKNSSNHFMI